MWVAVNRYLMDLTVARRRARMINAYEEFRIASHLPNSYLLLYFFPNLLLSTTSNHFFFVSWQRCLAWDKDMIIRFPQHMITRFP